MGQPVTTIGEFNSLYWGEQLPYRAVAERIGVPTNKLRAWIKKNRTNLKLRTKSEALKLAFDVGRHNIEGESNPNYVHGYTRLECKRYHVYGLTPLQFQHLIDCQNNRCKLCKLYFDGESKATTACVDHDHKTGKVRGLLCDSCNKGLGSFRDNIDTLENAIQYLKTAPPGGMYDEL
jgi:hypothetical protein